MNEQETVQKLTAKFPFLTETTRVARIRRIFCGVPKESFREVLDFVVQELGFSILCTITGVDDGDTIGAIYHLAVQSGGMFNLKVNVPKDNPVFKSVTDIFPSAEMYEREIIDLLGAKVEGLKAGRRYPLHETWPAGEYPLRKDWTYTKGKV